LDFFRHLPGHYGNWMYGIQSFSVIKNLNENNWVTHTLLELPWPVGNRELITQNILSEDVSGNGYRIDIRDVNSSIPVKNNILRLLNYHASWNIKEINPENVKITFTARIEGKPFQPRYISAPLLNEVFLSSFKKLKALLQ
jgi:hypothetical protein